MQVYNIFHYFRKENALLLGKMKKERTKKKPENKSKF